jgi:hypothetical protein
VETIIPGYHIPQSCGEMNNYESLKFYQDPYIYQIQTLCQFEHEGYLFTAEEAFTPKMRCEEGVIESKGESMITKNILKDPINWVKKFEILSVHDPWDSTASRLQRQYVSVPLTNAQLSKSTAVSLSHNSLKKLSDKII